MNNLDIVIPYRATHTLELKYVLRSLKNIKHRLVFICGDKPTWVSDDVICLTKDRYGVNAQHDSELNLRLALMDNRLSTEFILMADDIFILNKINDLPDYYTGTINEAIREKSGARFITYCQALQRTKEFIKCKDPGSFELHVPAIMQKYLRSDVSNEVLPILERGITILPRSIYYNRYCTRPVQRKDVKLYDSKSGQLSGDFLSTDDGEIPEQIFKMFPEKSKYEK